MLSIGRKRDNARGRFLLMRTMAEESNGNCDSCVYTVLPKRECGKLEENTFAIREEKMGNSRAFTSENMQLAPVLGTFVMSMFELN